MVKSALASRMLLSEAVSDYPHCGQLARHVARSRGSVRAYAVTLEALARAGASPELMARHDRHARVIFENIRDGKGNQERAASMFLRQLHEEADAYDHDMSFLMGKDTHESFVRAFEKEFKVKVHHHDAVGNGVYLYLDEEATDTVRNELDTSYAVFDRVYEKLGYILLRRGQKEDVAFGHFGCFLSTWIFVHVSRPPSGPPDLEGTTYSKQKLAKLERALREAYGGDPAQCLEVHEEEFEHGGKAYIVNAGVNYRVTDDSDMNPESGYGPLKVPQLISVDPLVVMAVNEDGSLGPEVMDGDPVLAAVTEWLSENLGDRLANSF